MEPMQYDILRREKGNAAVWLETLADLNTARFRIKQIVSFWPGRYEVVEHQSQRIVAVASRAGLHVPFKPMREFTRKCFLISYQWLLGPAPRVADLAAYKSMRKFAQDRYLKSYAWLSAPMARVQAYRSR